MTLKKLKTIDIFLVFGLCFLTHFLYSWFPCTLFSIFFPVNESIWEHMKMIFTSFVIVSFIDAILIKRKNIDAYNLVLSTFVISVLCIVIFLLIYLPIFNLIGENFIINVAILFITIYFSEIISFFIMEKKEKTILNYLSIVGIILCYTIFGILTYNPPKNDLFLDFKENKYGINTYNI